MKDYIEKAKILIEALPYIKNFNGKIFVIKYGGSALTEPAIKETIMQDIALMKLVGIKPILVHGGGAFINDFLDKLGIKSKFIDGLRVTDKETMEVVEMVLAGKINKNIVNDIQKQNLNAVGICGKDGDVFIADKKIVNGKDLGFVGEITKVNPYLINELLKNGIIPVIAPIGKDSTGDITYNINADNAAAALASELNAEKLVYLTNVEGVLKDINDSTSLISVMKIDKVAQFIEEGIISKGMIPKVECCVEAVQQGVDRVHILDGRIEHSLLLEIFTQEGIGTMFEK